MKRVYIAEKPDIGRALAGYLWPDGGRKGNGYIYGGDTYVTWAFGHILGLAFPKEYGDEYASFSRYPVFPEKFKLVPNPKAREQLGVIERLVADADEVVNGGDPDREGQLLVDEILEYLGYRGKVLRILVNAKDDASLKRAFESIEDNAGRLNLYRSGQAREYADWLVGMNLSRAYTVNAKKFGYDTVFRIGRVKMPTLALVVNRQKEIENFKPVNYYGIKGIFAASGAELFKAQLEIDEKLFRVDSENRVLDKAEMETALAGLRPIPVASVVDVKETAGKTSPPLPYSLDTLQVDANKKLHLSPQQVLDVVQKLYEAKRVSYPRSDCNYLPESQRQDAAVILPRLAVRGVAGADRANPSQSGKCWSDKKVNEHAHHAIVPTGDVLGELSGMEEKVYALIAQRYVLQFLPPCEWRSINFVLSCGEYRFKGSGKMVTAAGWKDVSADSAEDEKEDEDANASLPALRKGDSVSVKELSLSSRVTKPPAYFTEGTLLKAMVDIYKFMDSKNPFREKVKEVKGIGTPATRATIIGELMSDKTSSGHPQQACMKVEKGHLVPTEFGKLVIQVMDPAIILPDNTAIMETRLSDIAAGTLSRDAFVRDVERVITETISAVEKKQFPPPADGGGKPCPFCGKVLVRRFSKKNNSAFWVCPDVKCVSPADGKTVYYDDARGQPVVYACQKCGHPLKRVNGKNGYFWSCRKCKSTFGDSKGKPAAGGKK